MCYDSHKLIELEHNSDLPNSLLMVYYHHHHEQTFISIDINSFSFFITWLSMLQRVFNINADFKAKLINGWSRVIMQLFWINKANRRCV